MHNTNQNTTTTRKLLSEEERKLRHNLAVKRAKTKYRKTQKYRDAKKNQNHRYYLRKKHQQGKIVKNQD